MNNKIKIRTITFAIWIISSAFIYKNLFTIYNYSSDISSRQYGNTISFDVPVLVMFLILLIMIIFNRGTLKIKRKKDDLSFFFLILIISFFIPFNANWKSAFVGLANLAMYALTYIIIKNFCDFEELKGGTYIGFACLCVLEVGTGLLYYVGITIPYITTIPMTAERNGMARMQGTMLHPGIMSYMLGITFLFFASMFFFGKKRNALIFMIISYIGIYFSYARTALIFVTIILCILLWVYYRKNHLIKILMVTLLLIGGYQVVTSEYFYALFFSTSIQEMFQARFLHWIIGWRIMSESVSNFLFGIGINNNIDYIDQNYQTITNGLSSSAILTMEFTVDNPIHNAFFVVGVESGFFVMLYYLVLVIRRIFKPILSIKYESNNTEYKYFVLFSMLWYFFYSIQGWGSLSEAGFMLFMVICLFYYYLC